jgi:hypothetical protein
MHRAPSAQIHATHEHIVKNDLDLETINADHRTLGADRDCSRVLDKNDTITKLE